MCEDFEKITHELQENVRIIEENNIQLKNKIEELERKIIDLESYKIKVDPNVNEYENESLIHKNELFKIFQELETVKKNFQFLHQHKEYMGKEDELRLRKELNEEKLTKLYKGLEKSKEGSKKLFVVYNKVLMKNKTLEIDKEVQLKEILNLSEIIDQEREKK